MIFKTVEDILKSKGKTNFRITNDGLVSVYINGRWHYFNYSSKSKQYIELRETTLKFSR